MAGLNVIGNILISAAVYITALFLLREPLLGEIKNIGAFSVREPSA